MLGVSPLLILLLMGFQDLSVQFQRIQSSKPENATWRGMQSDGLSVRVDGQETSVPFTALKTLQFNNRLSPSDSAIVVVLRDGSRIQPSQVLSQGQKIQLLLAPDSSITIPANFVRTIQFQKLNEIQQTQWRAIQESRIAGDTLVVVRSAEALDKVEGVINGIEADKVMFEFSQQKIEAPRLKLAGLKFFSPPSQNQRVLAVINDIWGNSWQAHQLKSQSADSLDVTLACGAELTIPLSQLNNIDFSIGSMQYVADLKPIDSQRSGGFALKVPIPGSDQLFGAQSVRLPQTNGPSLRMLGNGSATYRVPAEYQSLTGKVFLSPDGQQFTPCTVQIKLENNVLWEGKLADLSQRLEFDVKIQADQRLQFLVQTESKYPVGDVVVWQELRMLK
jgi:hypothetical protein